jgi:hypothetical protein
MPRTTDTTIAVTQETKQMLDYFARPDSMTHEEVLRTLIVNSIGEKIESGIVPDEPGDTDGKQEIGAECEKCDNRVFMLPLRSEGTPECSQCGWNWFDPVYAEVEMVFIDRMEGDEEDVYDDLIAQTVDDDDSDGGSNSKS